MLDPVDNRCQIGSDPRLTDEERARIAGPQYTGLPYVMPRADGFGPASCCGESRVTPEVDACYDHAKVCKVCDAPSVAGLCPTCGPAKDTERQDETR